jgi:TM2 domain-containing membrane protein YozV
MFCKHCGKAVEEKAEICVHCGHRLRSSFVTFLESSELTQLRPQKTVKSPGLAGFLGFVFGWLFIGPVGYIYLGQWNWFWITVVISLVAYPLTLLIGAWVVLPFIFAFHQYQMAKELNELYEKNRSQGAADAPEDSKTPTPGNYYSGS